MNTSRPISGIERIMLRFGETMGADMVIGRVAGVIDPEAFRNAAATVVRSHPMLRVRVEGRPPERFVALDYRAVPAAVQIRRGSWQEAAIGETRRPFALTGEPACRFLLVLGEGDEPGVAHAIIAAAHAVVDGRCLMRLLDDLLTAWAAAVRGEDAGLPERPLTPAATKLMRHPWLYRGAAPLLRRVWLSELQAYQARPPLTPRGAVRNDGDIATLATFREGSPGGWSRLQAACRGHQITVGAALLAATWFALARLIAVQRGAPPARLKLDVNVDLRSHVNPPAADTHIGFWIGVAAVGGKVAASTDFWSLARRLRRDLTRSIRFGLPQLVQLLLEPIPDCFEHLESRGVHRHGTGGTGSLATVSNVGSFPYDPMYGAFRLTGIWGFNGTCLHGPAFISWLRFVDGKLFYNAIGGSPAVDSSQLECFQDAIFELLEDAPVAVSVEEFSAGKRGPA